jgi:hypothetical protein
MRRSTGFSPQLSQSDLVAVSSSNAGTEQQGKISGESLLQSQSHFQSHSQSHLQSQSHFQSHSQSQQSHLQPPGAGAGGAPGTPLGQPEQQARGSDSSQRAAAAAAAAAVQESLLQGLPLPPLLGAGGPIQRSLQVSANPLDALSPSATGSGWVTSSTAYVRGSMEAASLAGECC